MFIIHKTKLYKKTIRKVIQGNAGTFQICATALRCNNFIILLEIRGKIGSTWWFPISLISFVKIMNMRFALRTVLKNI